MPKISAPSVAEHHAAVQTRLVDAAEEILRSGSSQPLTAAAVTSAAGIARNSIYRYVDSVDDLRTLVVERYLPEWMATVAAGTAGLPPAERIVAWVRINLEQAAATGHGWLIEAARTAGPSAAMDDTVTRAHAGVRGPLEEAWRELLGDDSPRVMIASGLTVGLLDAGFGLLDRELPAEAVTALGAESARALTVRLPFSPPSA